MKKTKLAKIEIEKNLTGITENDMLPPEIMKMLEDKLPEWLKEYEADGTAVVRWVYEQFMLIEELLRYNFNFNEDELMKLEKKFKKVLPTVHQMKVKTPRLLNKQDFNMAISMVERNKQLYKQEKSGIALPTQTDLKRIGKK